MLKLRLYVNFLVIIREINKKCIETVKNVLKSIKSTKNVKMLKK
jgi:hypothetical protein